MVEIVRDHADLLAFGDDAAVEHAVGVQRLRIHVHVTEADVLGAAVDLKRRSLVLGGTDHHGVAHGDDAALLGIAGFAAVTGRGAVSGADVLALVAIAAAALPDFEAA